MRCTTLLDARLRWRPELPQVDVVSEHRAVGGCSFTLLAIAQETAHDDRRRRKKRMQSGHRRPREWWQAAECLRPRSLAKVPLVQRTPGVEFWQSRQTRSVFPSVGVEGIISASSFWALKFLRDGGLARCASGPLLTTAVAWCLPRWMSGQLLFRFLRASGVRIWRRPHLWAPLAAQKATTGTTPTRPPKRRTFWEWCSGRLECCHRRPLPGFSRTSQVFVATS